MLEYQSDRTIIHTVGGKMSSLFNQSEFLDVFTPDGIWIALKDSMIIGVVLLGKYKEAKPPCIVVYGIRVDEPYLQKGIGGILLQKADMYARTNGIDRLILHTTPDNIAAMTLFKKAGYRVVEETDDRLTLLKKVWIR
jgi:N-acetylglutamate synthase-like GNAT family acetyltransferase